MLGYRPSHTKPTALVRNITRETYRTPQRLFYVPKSRYFLPAEVEKKIILKCTTVSNGDYILHLMITFYQVKT